MALVNPTANETGLIPQAGTFARQVCYVYNLASFTLVFAALATSNMADGVSGVIPALTCRGFL